MFLNPSFLLNLIYPLYLFIVFHHSFLKIIPSFPGLVLFGTVSTFAEITAQIYGGICLFKQTPPYDFYCHPHFDSDNYFLFKI